MQPPISRLNSSKEMGTIYEEYMSTNKNPDQYASDSKPRPVVGFFSKPTPDAPSNGMTLKERCERVTLVPTGNEDDLPY